MAIDPASGDRVMGDNDDPRGDSGCVAGYNPPRLCITPAPNAPYNNDQEISTAAVRVPSG